MKWENKGAFTTALLGGLKEGKMSCFSGPLAHRGGYVGVGCCYLHEWGWGAVDKEPVETHLLLSPRLVPLSLLPLGYSEAGHAGQACCPSSRVDKPVHGQGLLLPQFQ